MIAPHVFRRFALLCGLVSWFPALVEACSCGQITPEYALGRSDVVFVGRVISREEPPPQFSVVKGDTTRLISTGDKIRYGFIAIRGWKGEPAETLTVYTARAEMSCGVAFRVGVTYLVYASWSPGARTSGSNSPIAMTSPRLATHLCSRTSRLERAAEDLVALGLPAWTSSAGADSSR